MDKVGSRGVAERGVAVAEARNGAVGVLGREVEEAGLGSVAVLAFDVGLAAA